jgi:uncharacterized protein (DUF885 family)
MTLAPSRPKLRLALLMLGLSAACASSRPATVPNASTLPLAAAATAEWDSFVAGFIERYLALHPSFAVAQGRHELDGRLPDWSPSACQQEIAWLERSRAEALGFSDGALAPEQRFQRDYVLSRIDTELFWLRDTRQPFTNPAFYFDSGLDPNTYVNVPYAPLDQRLRAFIHYALAIPNALAQIRANLQTPLPKTFVDYAVAGFRGFADFYRNDVPLAFAAVRDEDLQQQLKSALSPAAQKMSELGDWLAAQTVHASTAYVLGPQRFSAMLQQTEAVATPLDQLAAIGEADLSRNLAALDSACRTYLPNGTIRACVDKQNADKPEGGPVEGARQQLDALRRYVVEHDIVSIPGPEVARVEAAPAYRRQNFAYIDIPGPYEKNLPSVYYIAPPDPAWSKAEQDAYVPGKADLLFTSVHEVWPGHFLQFLHSNRSHWRFGQLFVGYAFSEGWAHYSEELMVEEGLAKDAPEREVGQILNALLRDVRFVCAIGLHTQGMTVNQCEQLFKDKAFQDAGNARQQAARGTYDPAYLNYTLGKLMIRKLRADWQAENPGRSRRQFHDALLSSGGPPIPLLRARLLKQPGDQLF